MKFLRATGVPLPITVFAIVMGVAGTVIGLQALFDPTTALDFVDGADKMGIAWGGRNAGLGVVMLSAVVLRNVFAYTAAFAASMFRELSDIVAGLSDGGSFTSAVAVLFVMLLLEVVCFAICANNTRDTHAAT